MRYLLDTNAVIALINRTETLTSRLRVHSPQSFGVSALVMHELYSGAHKSSRIEANLARVDELAFEILDFDPEDARVSGQVRAQLALTGTPIGPYDVLIAGQALSPGLTLISRNLRAFTRVMGLVVEDWESNPA